MKGPLDDLVEIAGLIRDRDLARLAAAAAATARIRGQEAALSADITARRAEFAAAPWLSGAPPGALEAWLRHARGAEARLAAEREALLRTEDTYRHAAARAFGRAAVLEEIAKAASRERRARRNRID